jgi:putative colanic acid biosynthesis glycosyltransferase
MACGSAGVAISVITVVYNDEEGISETRQSLRWIRSNDLRYEWIVIDGGSSDGTAQEARLGADGASRTVVRSERDDGIYHAMNKGLELAEGEYCIYLNAGDVFLDGAAALLVEFLSRRDTEVAVKVFGIIAIRNGKLLPTRNFTCPEQLRTSPAVPHQSTLIRVDDAISSGGYDESFRLLGDYDFFCRLYAAGKKFEYSTGSVLASFKQGGASTRAANQIQMVREAATIQRKYFGRRSISYAAGLLLKSFLLTNTLFAPLEVMLRKLAFARK